MWKFSKKDTPEKTEPDNIMGSSDTENPDVEEVSSSVEDNVIGKKNLSTKTIVIIMIAVIAVLVISLVIFVCLYFSNNQNGHDNSGSSIVSNSESTASMSSVDSSLSEDDYGGYWHIQSVGEIEMVINSISDGKVNFTYRNWFFDPIEIEAELDGTVASFSYDQDGISFNGFLTFNPASVVMDITESNHEYIPVATYSFNERSQRSWFQSDNYYTSIPNETESNYQPETDSYNPYEEYPYDIENEEEYTEFPQSTLESEKEESSQEFSSSPNTGSSQVSKPEPSGVQLNSSTYGVGQLNTKSVKGVVFKWYDRYEFLDYNVGYYPSIDIISLDSWSYSDGILEVNFEIEVSPGYGTSLWWKGYDKDGYFVGENLMRTNINGDLREKTKGLGFINGFIFVDGTSETTLIPTLLPLS